MREAQSFEKYAAEAELLKNNLHIVTGQGVFRILKYSETGESAAEYAYSADMPPKNYVGKLFKRAAKLSRSIAPLKSRITEVEQALKSAEEQLYFAEAAEVGELKGLEELFKKSERITVSKAKESDFRVYEHGGALIYMGRGGLSNAMLLSKFSKGNDLWLHAHEIPSAHCIVRSSEPVTQDTLLYAASLVAAFSKNREESSVAVDYTLRKHVKKPKGTPPGFVTYKDYKTVFVKPIEQDEKRRSP